MIDHPEEYSVLSFLQNESRLRRPDHVEHGVSYDLHIAAPCILTAAGNSHLEYEDIAKLNPFYDEYKSFWELESDGTYSSLSSRTSSGSSSFRSGQSELDMAVPPLELSSSSPMHPIQTVEQVPAPEKPHVVVHGGNEHRTTYATFEKPTLAQTAVMEHEKHYIQLMLPVKTPIDSSKPDALDLDLVENPFKAKAVSHKKLFGDNGWLGDIPETSRQLNEKHMSKTFINLGKKIKHQVEEFVSLVQAYSKPSFYVPITNAWIRPRIWRRSTPFHSFMGLAP